MKYLPQRQRFSMQRPSLHWNLFRSHVQFISSTPFAQSLSPAKWKYNLIDSLVFRQRSEISLIHFVESFIHSPSQTHMLGMQILWPGHLNSSAAHVILQFSSSLKSTQLYSPLHFIRPGMHLPFLHLRAKEKKYTDKTDFSICKSCVFVGIFEQYKHTWIQIQNNFASCNWFHHFYRSNLNEGEMNHTLWNKSLHFDIDQMLIYQNHNRSAIVSGCTFHCCI